MNALDSPLEALALNYLTSGFLTAANNVWTWIAVITAAVSVWRIRTLSPRSRRLNREFPFPEAAAAVEAVSTPSEIERIQAAEQKSEIEVSVPSASAIFAFRTEGRTSGKFAVYYNDIQAEAEVEEEKNCGNYDDDCNAVEERLRSVAWLGNGWEVTMKKMRVSGMELYNYQDLTVLDGNVVRLWDGCRRRNSSPSSFSPATVVKVPFLIKNSV